MSDFKDVVTKQCFNSADKIISILDELKYTSERQPIYEGELRDLIAIEVRRNVNVVAEEFFKSVSTGIK